MVARPVRGEARDIVPTFLPVLDQGACSMTGFRHPALLFAFALSILLAAPSSLFPGVVNAQEATPLASDVGGGPVLFFNAPGMRRDLVETFAAEGALPAIAGVLAGGTRANGG